MHTKRDIEETVRAHLHHTLQAVDDPKPTYRGKVRDVFARDDQLWIVATDRISAFDQVLGTVPLKGALLTEQAVFWLHQTANIVPNHLLDRPDPRVMVCQKAEPLRVEMIVRGYLAGSLQREPAESRGRQYGLRIDPQMGAHEAFATPIVTPTTKADVGEHDAPLSLEEVHQRNIATKRQCDEMEAYALALFAEGTRFAKERGLLLVDTKYEFGLVNGKVTLIDEIHTADSSRYWIASSYAERMRAGQAPEMLDKERLRRTLMDGGYDGQNLATLPALTDDMRVDLACHYWQLTEMLLGMPFEAPIPSIDKFSALPKSSKFHTV